METVMSIKKFYELKNILRYCSVKHGKESSAEHSWSCMMLADYFLTEDSQNLDRMKVYELLMYHDIVEIEAGDTPLHPEEDRSQQVAKELKAAEILKEQLPETLRDKFMRLFEEFEAQETPEAKFAKAIDKMDAIIHELDYKTDWKGWSEKFLRDNKEAIFRQYPAMEDMFEKIVKYLNEKGYFDQ